MDASVGERLAAVRSELGALTVQLAELDAKVAEWASRAEAVQAALAEAAPVAPTSAEADPRGPEPAEPLASEAPRRGRTRLFEGDLPATAAAPPRESPAPPETEAGPAGAQADEDEALLATLEPELAKAVRVKRRLSGRRSVREIIAELNAERPGANDVTARKTRRN